MLASHYVWPHACSSCALPSPVHTRMHASMPMHTRIYLPHAHLLARAASCVKLLVPHFTSHAHVGLCIMIKTTTTQSMDCNIACVDHTRGPHIRTSWVMPTWAQRAWDICTHVLGLCACMPSGLGSSGTPTHMNEPLLSSYFMYHHTPVGQIKVPNLT